jgi:carboxyl-terminal processing protease
MSPRTSGWVTLALVAALGAGACGGSKNDDPPTQPTGGISERAREYLDRALQVMETNHVNRLRLDWTALKAAALALAAGAQTPADTYPAIGAAIRLLDDNHSRFADPSGATVASAFRGCASSSAAVTPTIPPTIGYVRVPSFGGAGDAATTFANGLQRDIMAADRDDLAGWIVDVRGNGGGNMWPMVAGVGPILGEGIAGFFIASNGAATVWDYRGGASRVDGSVQQRVDAPYTLRRAQPRVAVLTDSAVVSSGEATVIAFRGRPETRSFGTPTCGASTALQGFQMSDNAVIFLTVATMADRNRTPYGGQVVPDEVVTDSSQVVDRAIAWLRGQG